MSKEDKKIDNFLERLSVKEIFGRDRHYLQDIIDSSGLPKEDFFSNSAFHDFVLTRFSVDSTVNPNSFTEEECELIQSMVNNDPTFAKRFLRTIERVCSGQKAKGLRGYTGFVATIATVSDSAVVRQEAFKVLNRFIDEKENVIGCFYPEHIENLKDPDLFMELVKKQVNISSKMGKKEASCTQLERFGLFRLEEFSKKFPVYKGKVGTLVKEAMDNNRINGPDVKFAKSLIAYAPTNKLAVLRKKVAHDIDETLGTKLEEKKIVKPLKKIEKVVSDKLFGKVRE